MQFCTDLNKATSQEIDQIMLSAKYIISVGIAIVGIGVIIYLFGDKLSWIGRLPGDIKIEKENFKLYFPLTTMLIISILLNAIIWLLKKYFN